MFFPLMPRARRLPSAKSEKSKAVKIVFIMPSALEMLSARKNMREKANSRYTPRGFARDGKYLLEVSAGERIV